MYLTHIQLSYTLAVCKLRIEDNYDWHQRIWQLFESNSGKNRDFLFRVERKKHHFEVTILSPEPSQLPGWLAPEELHCEPLPNFELGHYHFHVTANATRKVKTKNQEGNLTKNGSRLPLKTKEELEAWFHRKTENTGIQINTLSIHPQEPQKFRKEKLKKAGLGTHGNTDFCGTLEILNPEKFTELVKQGLGSSKAFGYGLFILRKLKNPPENLTLPL
jgi:CRISPR system Cascade subunit CasE